MITRRQLLGSMGATGAAALAAEQFLPETLNPPAPGDWAAVRQHYAFARAESPRIPLNAANLTPPLDWATRLQAQAEQRLAEDVSFHHRLLFLQTELARLRPLLAQHLGLRDGRDVALVRNTTEANALLINGLELGPEDEVVLWEQNHHSNLRSWSYRHPALAGKCRALRLPAQPRSDTELIEPFLAALTPRTRVVAFSHLSNISGLRLPAAALCKAIHDYRRDILVHVDGAQSWGALSLDLSAMDCDSYSASAHKWLTGPRELGILYLRRTWAERLRPATVGYNYFFEYPETALPERAARFECLGQRNDAALPALSAALEFQLALGPERVEQRIGELGASLRRQLRDAGLKLVTPEDPRYGLSVSVVEPPAAAQAVAIFRALYEQHGLSAAYIHANRVLCETAAPGNESSLQIRLCPHLYNNEQDLERAVAALRELV